MKKELVRDFLEDELSRLTYDDCDPERQICVIGLLKRLEKVEEWKNLAVFFKAASKDFLEEITGEIEKLDEELKYTEDEAAESDPNVVVLTKSKAIKMLRAQAVPNEKVLMVRGYGAHGGAPEEFNLWSEVSQSDLSSYQDGSDPFEGYEDRDFQLWKRS